MTHPIYTEQTLSILSLPHLKSIYNQIGCTLEIADKRRKSGYVSSILNFQNLKVKFVQLIADAEIEALPPAVSILEKAGLSVVDCCNGTYLINKPADLSITLKVCYVEAEDAIFNYQSAVQILPSYTELYRGDSIDPAESLKDAFQWVIKYFTDKPAITVDGNGLGKVSSEVQIGSTTLTLVQVLPSGQNAYRLEIDNKFHSFIFQVPDNYDNLHGTYHWEANCKRFATLHEALMEANRLSTPITDTKINPTTTEIMKIELDESLPSDELPTDGLAYSDDDLIPEFKFELHNGSKKPSLDELLDKPFDELTADEWQQLMSDSKSDSRPEFNFELPQFSIDSDVDNLLDAPFDEIIDADWQYLKQVIPSSNYLAVA